MAFVTVVIPVWDSYCDHLAESVWSALRQANVDARVIVVDNASERTVPDLGSEVRIVRSDVRLGVGAARNLGLAAVEDRLRHVPRRRRRPAARRARLPRAAAGGRPAPRDVGRTVRLLESGDRRTCCRTPLAEASRAHREPAAAVVRARQPALEHVPRRGLRPPHICGPPGRRLRRRERRRRLDSRRDALLPRPNRLRRARDVPSSCPPRVALVPAARAYELLERCRALRERATRDPAVPGWAKALLPLLAHLHGRSVRRATQAGVVEPESPVLATEPGR